MSLVTQFDVERVHRIEEAIGKKLQVAPGFHEDDVLKLLSKTATAMRVAKMRLSEDGFDARVAKWRARKHKQRAASAAGEAAASTASAAAGASDKRDAGKRKRAGEGEGKAAKRTVARSAARA